MNLNPDMIVAWFQSLAERERRFVVAGAIALVSALILGLFMLDHSVSRAHARVARKQSELVWMRSVAPQLAAAAPAAAVPISQRSLIVVVNGAANESGLGVASSEPSGQGGLRVRLDKAPFDTLVGWLARLSQQHGIKVASATFDSAGAPGLVNAGIVLEAAR